VLCALPRVNSPIRVFQLNEKFAQAAEILKDSSTEFAEFGVFLNQEIFSPRPPRLSGEISEFLFTTAMGVVSNRVARLTFDICPLGKEINAGC